MTDAGVDAGDPSGTLERPAPEATVAAIEVATESGHVVALVGHCAISPDEREGDLDEPADRLALVKPDGSVVVHGDDGTAPLFEFAPDGGVAIAVVEGRVRIGPARGRTAEWIEFERVDRLASFALGSEDAGEIVGDPGDERRRGHPSLADSDRHGSLRERLLADPDLIEPGFRPLSTERETAAGPVDLYGRDAEGRAVVVEIKTNRAGPAVVGQLDRYVSALRRDLHADTEVRGVLVAPSATDRTQRLLSERGFAFRTLSPDG